MLVFLLLQDCSPGGAAKPPQVPAAAHMAMVETVAEGEAHAERHAHRGRNEGTYKRRSQTDLFLASNIIITFRSLTEISNLPSLPPHTHFKVGPC